MLDMPFLYASPSRQVVKGLHMQAALMVGHSRLQGGAQTKRNQVRLTRGWGTNLPLPSSGSAAEADAVRAIDRAVVLGTASGG
mgnify:CR=1 FL=1